MPGDRLGRATRHASDLVTQQAAQGKRLSLVVERRAGAMGIDVIDIDRVDPATSRAVA